MRKSNVDVISMIISNVIPTLLDCETFLFGPFSEFLSFIIFQMSCSKLKINCLKNMYDIQNVPLKHPSPNSLCISGHSNLDPIMMDVLFFLFLVVIVNSSTQYCIVFIEFHSDTLSLYLDVNKKRKYNSFISLAGICNFDNSLYQL